MSAKRFTEAIIPQLSLCFNINNKIKNSHQCTEFEMGKCYGACIGIEDAESYNHRILDFIGKSKMFDEDTFALVDIGRNYDESTIALVENNKYAGYGYFNNKEQSISSLEDVQNIITSSKANKDYDMIIRRFINENRKNIKIITW